MKVKVVYTVLEAQYQSALTAAVQAINASNKTVCFELVGYLLEELRDSSNYETFKQDLEDANVFIGSLIFIEELAEKVRHRGMARRRGGEASSSTGGNCGAAGADWAAGTCSNRSGVLKGVRWCC